jgi:ABC-type multidrug transport system fused ATPase/permease subunit
LKTEIERPEPSESPSLLGYIWAYRFRFSHGLGFTLARAAVIAPLPFLFRLIIDEHVRSGNLLGIVSAAFAFAGLLCLHYFFAVVASHYYAHAVARMMMELRGRIFQKLQLLSFAYFDEQQTGRLISKYAFDTQRIETAILPMLRQLLPETLVSLCIIGLLATFNWQLMLLLGLVVPIYGVGRTVFFGRMKALQQQARVAQEGMTGQASELIGAIRLIRGFGQEKEARETMHESSEHLAVSRAEQMSITAVYQAFAYVSMQFLALVVVAGGAWLVIQGELSFGTLVAFLAALPIILAPVQLFVSFSQQYILGRESYVSVKELLDSIYVEKWKGTRKISNLRGDIKFENVTFAYTESDLPAVRDINLHIEPGQKVAFVGPSGSGKSTLANLILGLYRATEGAVLIDGLPQAAINMRWFRRHSAIVMQESMLLSGSIGDNIRFARPSATEREIREAARQANAEEFIERMPNGYNTEVGEAGVQLSGGQRQRISIARAILRDPRVLILDEATSALDYESEALVQEAIDRLGKGRTVIVIAHRFSTIKNSDHIVVMRNGSIVESGTFESLAKGESFFTDMIRADSDSESGSGGEEPPSRE